MPLLHQNISQGNRYMRENAILGRNVMATEVVATLLNNRAITPKYGGEHPSNYIT
tara:strand:+ start:511 stop:675 length:165 start_codon:yes stop_codon:yes gene_type:complete